jgi:hypothetical protein
MTMDATTRRLAALLLCAAMLPACNDDDTLVDDDGGTLTDPTGAEVVFTQSFPIEAAVDLQRPAILSYDVAVPSGGVVRAEVDWTSIEHDIDILVAKDDCRSGIAAWNGECTVYDQDRSSLTKPARVDFSLAAAANLRVYVFNFSTAPETAVLQVLHRP